MANHPSSRRVVTFDTAAAQAEKNVPMAAVNTQVSTVLKTLVGRRYASATHVVVVDSAHRFLGLISMEELLAAPPNATTGEIMDAKVPVVAPSMDQEIAAWQAAQQGKSAMPVVGADGQFIGLIPPQRLSSVLLEEYEQDLLRFSGFFELSSGARTTSIEPVVDRVWHRIPWLLVGLLGAMLSADIVAAYEAGIREKILLAFFIPAIVYLADAVGTQTETVVIRGFSVGVDFRQIVRSELLTGLAIGTLIALSAFPILCWRWGDLSLAFGVSLALLAACSTATLAAMALPWLLARFQIDPAFGSGPLATVIQDLLSILIYFAIATSLVA